MDWIVWLLVIIVVVAVVWRLLNRNKSRPGADSSSAAGTSTGTSAGISSGTPADATPVPGAATASGSAASSTAATSPAGPAAAAAAGPTAAGGAAGPTAAAGAAMAAPGAASAPEPDAPAREATAAPEATGPAAATAAPTIEPGAEAAPETTGAPGNAEWETQWSETAPPAETHTAAAHAEPARGAHAVTAAELGGAAETGAAGLPVHHPEYTEPHAPTLPGAESAAAEPVDDENTVTGTATSTSTGVDTGTGTAMPGLPDAGTQPTGPGVTETTQMAASPAGAGASASQTAEPTGHLATEQPYGEGSAAPAADGSGPEGFTVKGNASSMIYHDETSPAYEETRAEVWFASPAHAEAAGFRPPRRTRQ